MSDTESKLESGNSAGQALPSTSDVVIGILTGLDVEGIPLVVFPDSQSKIGVPARATVALTAEDVGREMALLFEQGDPARPLIIGRIYSKQSFQTDSSPASGVTAKVDDERVELTAKKEIVLNCGKSSITLTKAGKILIRGEYVLTRSTGVNRILGGSVQVN